MAKSKAKSVDEVKFKLGLVVVAVLLAIGGGLWYGYKQATNEVRKELSSQKIFFPEKGSPALDAKTYPDLQKYAGQQVDTGPEAKAYANGFIGRHLKKVAGGKTYAEVSSAAQKDPNNQKLQAQKQALFQGETLRGLLLGNGYGYWTFGVIAKYAALGAFAVAGLVAGWVVLGHKRR